MLNLNYYSRLKSRPGRDIIYNAGYPAPGWNLGFARIYYLESTGGYVFVVVPVAAEGRS